MFRLPAVSPASRGVSSISSCAEQLGRVVDAATLSNQVDYVDNDR
jgi:hypothetical protein